MEQLLTDNGWTKQTNGDYQHRDGRALVHDERGWRLMPIQGKALWTEQTLKAAMARLGLSGKQKVVAH